MSIKTIEQEFIEKVSEMVRLSPEGRERFRVFTPFMFDDGDHLVIVLKKEGNKWILSDEAHTYMHLTYEIDEKSLHSGTRQKIISNALSTFAVEDRNGELILEISDARYGDALYDFVQALLKIVDVSYLSRERVQSTFMEDFRTLLSAHVPEEYRIFDWHDLDRDQGKKYTVDCRINGTSEPLFVYALSSDNRIRDAIIALQKIMQWDDIQFRPLGIFRNRQDANRKVLMRFNDVCSVQFSSLDLDRDAIVNYLGENVQRMPRR